MLRRYGMFVVAMGVALLAFPANVRAQAKLPLVIADFESGNVRPFEGGSLVSQSATHGQGALEVRPGQAAKATKEMGLPADWSQYDVVKFDVFNPSEAPVTLNIEIVDPRAMDTGHGIIGWWGWRRGPIRLSFPLRTFGEEKFSGAIWKASLIPRRLQIWCCQRLACLSWTM